MSTGAALVRLAGVEWSAGGRRILGPLDLEIVRGERLAVVGPNGAGKTTLLRLAAGLLRPTAGELAWQGRPYPALGRREMALRVAYVPQLSPQRIPLTVEQLVMQGRFPHISRLQIAATAADFSAVEAALAEVGLDALRARPLGELSGGERQAAFIAGALAQRGELLVLDEPTTHLDPGHQRDIAGLVSRLGGEGAGTVLTATHDLNFASLVADRVVALQEGRVLAVGPPAEILTPARLERLFGAPFEVVRGGERPVTVLELGR